MNTTEDNRRIAAGDPDLARKAADVVVHVAECDHDDGQPRYETADAAADYLMHVVDGELADAIGCLGYTEAGRLYNATRIRARARAVLAGLDDRAQVAADLAELPDDGVVLTSRGSDRFVSLIGIAGLVDVRIHAGDRRVSKTELGREVGRLIAEEAGG